MNSSVDGGIAGRRLDGRGRGRTRWIVRGGGGRVVARSD